MDKTNNTTTERASDREIVLRRTFRAPARIVFEAWTRPELFVRWWLPKSMGMSLHSYEMDIRTGGKYRLVLSSSAFPQPMEFFGSYIEVTPHSRIVWTNEESGENGSTTTVTFEEKNGNTLLVLRELYPSKQALDANAGASDGMGESFEQLDEVIDTLRVS